MAIPTMCFASWLGSLRAFIFKFERATLRAGFSDIESMASSEIWVFGQLHSVSLAEARESRVVPGRSTERSRPPGGAPNNRDGQAYRSHARKQLRTMCRILHRCAQRRLEEARVHVSLKRCGPLAGVLDVLPRPVRKRASGTATSWIGKCLGIRPRTRSSLLVAPHSMSFLIRRF